jgi:hypothetical protein
MAQSVTPTNIQKMEFDVTTPEGPCRVTMVTGSVYYNLQAFSDTNAPASQTASLSALVDPKLTPGQFRKATATVAITQMGDSMDIPGGVSSGFVTSAQARWTVDEVKASLDDESGQIELRIDVAVQALRGYAFLERLNFQVTTLSKIP